MILGALSYSINDLSVLHKLTEEQSVAHSASNNTYDPLVLQTPQDIMEEYNGCSVPQYTA